MNKMKWLAAIAVVLTSGLLQADLVALNPNKDTVMRASGTTDEADYGAATQLLANSPRLLFSFDLASVSGSITNAVLRLTMANSPTTVSWNYVVSPMVYTANNYSWLEGAGTSSTALESIQPADATSAASYKWRRNGVTDLQWENLSGTGLNNMANAELWGASIGSASGTSWVSGNTITIALTASMLETFRTNGVGSITIGIDTTGTTASSSPFVWSKEAASAGNRPVLELQVIPEPATLGLFVVSSLGIILIRRVFR